MTSLNISDKIVKGEQLWYTFGKLSGVHTATILKVRKLKFVFALNFMWVEVALSLSNKYINYVGRVSKINSDKIPFRSSAFSLKIVLNEHSVGNKTFIQTFQCIRSF